LGRSATQVVDRPFFVPLTTTMLHLDWKSLFLLLLPLVMISCSPGEELTDRPDRAPDWVSDAVFYQIFPERFRNGDPGNDPIRESLDFLEFVPSSWHVSEWTKDWYAMDAWEEEKSADVFTSMFDRRFGGDIQGVIDSLPYLKDLGIDAIWLNPVFAARSLHKYDGSSFHHIDPHFGPDPEGDKALMLTETEDPASWKWTAADQLFLDLVQEAHDLGIRIVLDGVWNHSGRGFFAFQDVRSRQQESPFAHWYKISSFDNPGTAQDEFDYEGWSGFEALPEFAHNGDGSSLQDEVAAYIMAASSRWMDPDGDGSPEDGIDGWRLDVAQEVPLGFWKAWHEHVRKINPQVYTVAEIWEPASDFIAEAGFSAAMNYYAFSMPVKGYFIDGLRDAHWFAEVMQRRLAAWGSSPAEAQLNLIDSHDTPRLASMVANRVSGYQGDGNENDYDSGVLGPRSSLDYDIGPPDEVDQALMRLTILFQFTFTGAPIIYYGSEAGMWGADDPDNRKPMLWPDKVYDPQLMGPFGSVEEHTVGFDEAWHSFYVDLTRLHHRSKAMSRGEIRWLDHDWHDMVLAFTKRHGADSLTVIINRSPDTPRVPGRVFDDSEIIFSTEMTGGVAPHLAGEDWILPPWSGFVLISRE